MNLALDWISPNKLSEASGLSKSKIHDLLDTGDIEFSKTGKTKQSGLMIRISSFNKYWEQKRIVKTK